VGPEGPFAKKIEKIAKIKQNIRGKLQNPNEVRSILKQMGLPKYDWPENLK
jgi:hypothetical protein